MHNLDAFDYKNWKEELWNAITHGIGLAISIPACILLIIHSSVYGTAVYYFLRYFWRIFNFTVSNVDIIT